MLCGCCELHARAFSVGEELSQCIVFVAHHSLRRCAVLRAVRLQKSKPLEVFGL